jgi:hypothetical protein
LGISWCSSTDCIIPGSGSVSVAPLQAVVSRQAFWRLRFVANVRHDVSTRCWIVSVR